MWHDDSKPCVILGVRPTLVGSDRKMHSVGREGYLHAVEGNGKKYRDAENAPC
jgi:hypothetical protein